jgi:hypothetical protein
MNFVEDVKIIESDEEEINDKCSKIQCTAIYDTFKAFIKLFIDLFKCFKPKNI